MTKPNWNKTLKEVLGYETQAITKTSPRTGNEYTTDAIPVLKVLSTGSVESLEDGKFRYSIVDPTKGFEYAIKVAEKVDVKFGTQLAFKMVVGGSTNSGGWYSADSVQVVPHNA
ncbi:hypothetical protein [Enterococcus plantarum]|uniref:hypothetical protein n=1 Tax=Enterococcus plantarum TaxID=1077675 RepID=UPI001A8C5B5A|nr:hypothetical protein [Enterococcus plantarum]MBO0421373.1 hypothetical protein [Enterococcus plantarum]